MQSRLTLNLRVIGLTSSRYSVILFFIQSIKELGIELESGQTG